MSTTFKGTGSEPIRHGRSCAGKKGAFGPPDGVGRPESRDMMSMFMVKRDGRRLVCPVDNTQIDEVGARFDPVAQE